MVGSPNGVSSRRPFDRWFRYPAGFSPATLDVALDAVSSSLGSIIVDPFAGSGSAGTQALQRGLRYAGIEAHPIVAELADLKFCRPGDPEGLVRRAESLQICDASTADEATLVSRCFSDETLKTLTGIRNAILQDAENRWARHLKWALLATLRDVANVKVGWPYQRPSQQRTPPFGSAQRRFVQRVYMIAEDLHSAPDSLGGRVVPGDSRNLDGWTTALPHGYADACLTSPPYLNNFDYADATRLEAYFWGYASTWSELCTTVRSDMLIATTQQTRQRLAAAAQEHLSVYPRAAEEIARLRSDLTHERNQRSRGKEYDQVVQPYFVGVARVLAMLYKHLRNGSASAWIVGDSAPYGVYIDTPRLILTLAEDLGFEADRDILLRDRGGRWRTNGTRHKVALSERLITFIKA